MAAELASAQSGTKRGVFSRAYCVDLGSEIGSPGWFRGLVSLMALCALTLFLSPDRLPFTLIVTRPVPQAAPMNAETAALAGQAWAPAALAVRVPLSASPPQPPFGDGPVRLTGVAGPSLYATLRAQGLPFSVVRQYLLALSAHLDLGEGLAADARFDLVVMYRRRTDGEGGYGALLFAGCDQPGPRLRLLPWVQDGASQWLNALEIGGTRPAFVHPVVARRISSGFGLRFHPLLGYSRFHRGVDYAAAQGTPVRAVSDGMVVEAGWSGGYGQLVRLRHAGAMGSGYAHLSQILVAPGTRVRQGEVIGRVGSTGLATGPHLHFEVYRGGEAVDPADVRFASAAALSPSDQARFLARLKAMTRLPTHVSGPPPVAIALAQE